MTAPLDPAGRSPAAHRAATVARPAADRLRASHPGRQPRARVTDMARSLDFYLGLGCEVGRAADGWVQLTCGPVTFALVRGSMPDDVSGATPWIRLSTPDVRTLRRRLRHDGIPTGELLRPAHAPLGEIVALDPDRRLVAIGQLEPAPRTPLSGDPRPAGAVRPGPSHPTPLGALPMGLARRRVR